MRRALALSLLILGCAKPQPVAVAPRVSPSIPTWPVPVPAPNLPAYDPHKNESFNPASLPPRGSPSETPTLEPPSNGATVDVKSFLGKWTDMKDGRNTLTVQPGGLASATLTHEQEDGVKITALSGNYTAAHDRLLIDLTTDEQSFEGGKKINPYGNTFVDEKTGQEYTPGEHIRTVVVKATALLSPDAQTLRLTIPGASLDLTRVR